MNASGDQSATVLSGLILRTTPPRAPRHQLLRARLALDEEALRDRIVLVVQAPPGFGKTSLLGQWRREFLARGAAVAWLSANPADDPQHLLHGLTLAVRAGCGRPGFGRALLEGTGFMLGGMQGVTAWLAEVSLTALDMVLFIDEAERLAGDNREALLYLLHNLPSNLRIVLAGRVGLDELVADLAAYGSSFVVGAEMLRFRLDETIAFVRARFGPAVDADACARLHELSEGWPLGLQLLLTSAEGAGDARTAINSMLAHNDARGPQLVVGMLDQLSPEDRDFLIRIAVVDMVHPDLCRELTGQDAAAAQLARLMRDTPIFIVGDQGDWSRIHTLVRDALRARLADFAEADRVALHARAMRWMANRGLIREAAFHARAAGERQMALDFAEQCFLDAATQGYLGTVLEWLEDIPDEELRRRPSLQLAAAWTLALSDRQREAGTLVTTLLEGESVAPELRYECALIQCCAAYFADDPDLYVATLSPWHALPPLSTPRVADSSPNFFAIQDIFLGDPGQARRRLSQARRDNPEGGNPYNAGWTDYFIGLSYLWEGQVLLGEDFIRTALARTEAALGRRHSLACMQAALLAAAVYERDRPEEGAALLANRLDVLERVGSPDTVILGYRTAARIAAAQGFEHRALELLEALTAVGVARNLPRLCIASLAEQIRIHAAKFRSETCRALLARIEDCMAGSGRPPGSLWHRQVSLMFLVSVVNSAISAQDWQAAQQALVPAVARTDELKLGRIRIEVMALRAFVLERAGKDGRPLLLEAINLAPTYGLVRTFVDVHPILADWVRRLAEESPGSDDAVGALSSSRAVRPRPLRPPSAPRAVPSMVLTPKEREVLEFLARNLANKEIAQAMSVGEETVKWHLKNLFGKLEAGSRKHVVRRAQLLGLLEGGY